MGEKNVYMVQVRAVCCEPFRMGRWGGAFGRSEEGSARCSEDGCAREERLPNAGAAPGGMWALGKGVGRSERGQGRGERLHVVCVRAHAA